MKKLALVALIALLTVPIAIAGGNDATSQDAEPASATEATPTLDTAKTHEAASENVDLQVFVKMAIHDLESGVAAGCGADAGASAGGTCTVCTSHAQCTGPCGGFGACLRDLGHVCDVDWLTKVCFCG